MKYLHERKYGLKICLILILEPIFETQANIIGKNDYKGIVDVGCRHGPINDFTRKNYKDYQYYGFDTSHGYIEYARKRWGNKFRYEVNDWANLKGVEFDVDCIIFGGVLLYEKGI